MTVRAFTCTSRFVLRTIATLLLSTLERVFEDAVVAVEVQTLVAREDLRDWTGVIGQNTGALGFSEPDCLVLPMPFPPPLPPKPFPKVPPLPPLTQYERLLLKTSTPI